MPYNDFVGGYLLLPLTLKLCIYCTPPKELFMASKFTKKWFFVIWQTNKSSKSIYANETARWRVSWCNVIHQISPKMSCPHSQREIKTLILRRMIVKFQATRCIMWWNFHQSKCTITEESVSKGIKKVSRDELKINFNIQWVTKLFFGILAKTFKLPVLLIWQQRWRWKNYFM